MDYPSEACRLGRLRTTAGAVISHLSLPCSAQQQQHDFSDTTSKSMTILRLLYLEAAMAITETIGRVRHPEYVNSRQNARSDEMHT